MLWPHWESSNSCSSAWYHRIICLDHLIHLCVGRWWQQIVHNLVMFGGCSAAVNCTIISNSQKCGLLLLSGKGWCAVLGAEETLLGTQSGFVFSLWSFSTGCIQMWWHHYTIRHTYCTYECWMYDLSLHILQLGWADTLTFTAMAILKSPVNLTPHKKWKVRRTTMPPCCLYYLLNHKTALSLFWNCRITPNTLSRFTFQLKETYATLKTFLV